MIYLAGILTFYLFVISTVLGGIALGALAAGIYNLDSDLIFQFFLPAVGCPIISFSIAHTVKDDVARWLNGKA